MFWPSSSSFFRGSGKALPEAAHGGAGRREALCTGAILVATEDAFQTKESLSSTTKALSVQFAKDHFSHNLHKPSFQFCFENGEKSSCLDLGQ